MGKQQAFTSDDDVARLPVLPNGMRHYAGDDGRLWAGPAEVAALEHSMQVTWDSIRELAVPSWAGPALVKAGLFAEYRAMLDAYEAMTMADGLELACRGPLRCEVDQDPSDAESFPADPDRYLAERYGVDPQDAEVVRSNYLAELAGVTRTTVQRAGRQLFTAVGLRDACPETFQALSRGEITYRSASIIVSRAQDMEPEQVTELESQLLPVARRGTDQQVMDKSRRVRRKLLPGKANEARERAERGRKVTCQPERDGMSSISWYLPAEDAKAIMNAVDAHARSEFGTEAADGRSLAQLRSDIMRDALIDGWPGNPGPGYRVKLNVTIPAVEMLVDRGKGLAELEGHGPIPMGVALKLAGHAESFSRVLTDPWDGAPMDVGRRKYRPPQALRDFIALRDRCCTFPGCRKPPHCSEIDHIDDWARGGHTCRENTRLLCKQHQMYKHVLGWSGKYRPDGSILWRSPNGVLVESLPGSMVDGLCRSTDQSRMMHGPQRQPVMKLTPEACRLLALDWQGPANQWFKPGRNLPVFIGTDPPVIASNPPPEDGSRRVPETT